MKNYTIDEIYKEFLELKRPFLTPHTLLNYESMYSNHIAPYFATSSIDSLNYKDYQKFANILLSSGKKKNLSKTQIKAGEPIGLAPKTVKNILSVCSEIYEYAIKCEYYSRANFPRMVQLPAFDNKFYVDFSVDVLKKYLIAVRDFDEPIYRDMFFYSLQGRRESEVKKLKWEQLDLVSNTVYYSYVQNKSRKNLYYKLTKEMVVIFKRYQKIAIEQQGTPFLTGYVFINPDTGTKFTTLYKPWKRLLAKADLPYIKLHGLRHVIATYLFNVLDYSIDSIAVVLGHSDTSVTKTYITVLPFYAKRINESLLDSLKTKDERFVDELDKNIQIGECLTHVQGLLFPDKKSFEVGK